MNHPTLPVHTLRDKLAVTLIGLGWVGLLAVLFIPAVSYLWLKSAFSSSPAAKRP